MHIDNNPAWRSTSAAGPQVNEKTGQAPSSETRRISQDVATARNTALSALNNERFRVALEQLSDPRSSGAILDMRRDNGASTDFRSVQSSYAENSE